MEKPEKNKIRVLFSQSQDYRKVSANGVWGGPTPSGDILCNFFVEHLSLPDELQITISPTGEKESEEQVYKEGKTFVRETQIGVMMSPHVAKSIGEWMIQKADELISKGPTH